MDAMMVGELRSAHAAGLKGVEQFFPLLLGNGHSPKHIDFSISPV